MPAKQSKNTKPSKKLFKIHNPETGEEARSHTAKFNKLQKPKGWVKGALPK